MRREGRANHSHHAFSFQWGRSLERRAESVKRTFGRDKRSGVPTESSPDFRLNYQPQEGVNCKAAWNAK